MFLSVRPGQQILERSCLKFHPSCIEVRFSVGLPAEGVLSCSRPLMFTNNILSFVIVWFDIASQCSRVLVLLSRALFPLIWTVLIVSTAPQTLPFYLRVPLTVGGLRRASYNGRLGLWDPHDEPPSGSGTEFRDAFAAASLGLEASHDVLWLPSPQEVTRPAWTGCVRSRWSHPSQKRGKLAGATTRNKCTPHPHHLLIRILSISSKKYFAFQIYFFPFSWNYCLDIFCFGWILFIDVMFFIYSLNESIYCCICVARVLPEEK